MTIWTVSSVDADGKLGTVVTTAGSYTTRGAAIDKCVELVLEQIDLVPCLAHSMANDPERMGMERFFSERSSDGRTVIARGQMHKLEKLLRDEIERSGGYRVKEPDGHEWLFSVDENDVEGMRWTTVTWGDSDCEDPEFSTPWPASFTSEETAVETFIDYVKDLCRSHGMKWSDKLLRETRKSLKEDGKVQVGLRDGTSVSCVLYSGGAGNIKE